jgi:HEAT repeat protein
MIGPRRRRLLRELAHGDEAVRWEAARELAHKRDAATLRRLESLLQDGDDEARGAAAYVLGFSGKPELAPALARVLANRLETPTVRAYAAEGLGHLLQYETVLAEVRGAVLLGLRDAEPEVRFWSAFAAGVLELLESRPYLERLAATDRTPVKGWWTVAEEAEWAMRVLDGDPDPPQPRPTPTNEPA